MMLFTKVCQQQRHGSGLSLEEANIWSVAPPILARGAAAAARGKRQEAIMVKGAAARGKRQEVRGKRQSWQDSLLAAGEAMRGWWPPFLQEAIIKNTADQEVMSWT